MGEDVEVRMEKGLKSVDGLLGLLDECDWFGILCLEDACSKLMVESCCLGRLRAVLRKKDVIVGFPGKQGMEVFSTAEWLKLLLWRM